ncbi:MAG: orotidine-5'-phosphate decarboxylase [Candidatus Omnitrophica bacterium]|nr:orotidine-5'-phosphate decarboxylase [Candidatus Omnitrophota bacterium]
MPDLKDKIIVALDVDSLREARYFVDKLYPQVKIFKVGSQLFTACGPAAVKMVQRKGAKVFLDLKFCDIPNTVSKAVESAKDLGVYMLTVHTFGASRQALRAAVEAAKGVNSPIIIGVTLLTSLDKKTLNKLGVNRLITTEVLVLAQIAKEEGLDGIVCSPREIQYIRRRFGKEFIIVSPGIRPKGARRDDQKRFTTANEAISAGADFIVVGRPILEAKDPLKAVEELV